MPYVTDAVIAELKQKFGEETVATGGLRVQSTVDYNTQILAENTVRDAHNNYGNQLYAKAKDLQLALIAVEPETHFIKAMAGGVDYNKSQFNRALISRRQPGSAFKPFVYYTAFASGKYTPNSMIEDKPIRLRDGSKFYTPKNYGGGYSGTMSIRNAVVTSANVPAVLIGNRIGINKVVDVCRRMGIKSPLRR